MTGREVATVEVDLEEEEEVDQVGAAAINNSMPRNRSTHVDHTKFSSIGSTSVAARSIMSYGTMSGMRGKIATRGNLRTS